jgi:hypothetical protein
LHELSMKPPGIHPNLYMSSIANNCKIWLV